MPTPESQVKNITKKILDKYKPKIYYHMPVQAGYGKPSLDFIGAFMGVAFAIETKVPGASPTPRQVSTIEEMQAAGVRVFVFHGYLDEINELRNWLEGVSTNYRE